MRAFISIIVLLLLPVALSLPLLEYFDVIDVGWILVSILSGFCLTNFITLTLLISEMDRWETFFLSNLSQHENGIESLLEDKVVGLVTSIRAGTEESVSSINHSLDELGSSVEDEAEKVHSRIEKLEDRFGSIEMEIQGINDQLDRIEGP